MTERPGTGSNLVPGQLLECAIRDDAGHTQGTIVVKVVEKMATGPVGHYVKCSYVCASDAHYRWWATLGPGKNLSKGAIHHFCDGNAHECGEKYGRHQLIHVEGFRLLTEEVLATRSPAWMFSRACHPLMEADLKALNKPPEEAEDEGLPWVGQDEDKGSDESEYSGSSEDEDMKLKVARLKKELAAAEKHIQKGVHRRRKTTPAQGEDGKKKKRRKRRSEDQEDDRPDGEHKKEKKGKKKKKVQPGSARDKARGRSRRRERSRGRKRSSSSSTSKKKKEALFGGQGSAEDESDSVTGQKSDRGPFGAAEKERFRGDKGDDSSSESLFRGGPHRGCSVQPAETGRIQPEASRQVGGETAAQNAQRFISGLGGGYPRKKEDTSSGGALPPDHDVAALRTEGKHQKQPRVEDPLHSAGPPGAAQDRARGRHPGAEGEGLGTGLHRGTLGSSPIPRADRRGTARASGSVGAVLHEQGVHHGPEAERAGQDPESKRQRGPEGNQGPRRKERTGERSPDRKREGQGRERRQMSPVPGQPELDELDSTTEKVRTWRGYWSKFMEKEMPCLEVLSTLFERLKLLDSPLGQLCKTGLNKDVPPRASRPKPRGDDLLPFDLKGVSEYLADEAVEIRGAVQLAITCLNYLWLGHRDSGRYLPEGGVLTKGQRQAVDHVTERVKVMGAVDKWCPNLAAGKAQLVEAKFDYGGEPIMALEELCAEHVIPVWPAVGEAAVQSVVDYLPDELKSHLEDPATCLLPEEEWPPRPPQSKVRATQTEWDKIVSAAAARGIMVGVDFEDVFCDRHGNKVLNGAAGVKKLKKVGGEVKTMQRFISNFIPSTATRST